MKTRTQILITVWMLLAVLTGCAAPIVEPEISLPAASSAQIQHTESKPTSPPLSTAAKEVPAPSETGASDDRQEENAVPAESERTEPLETPPLETEAQTAEPTPVEQTEPPKQTEPTQPPAETKPAETQPPAPKPTEPPKETEPAPTTPTPTQPKPTEPKPTEPEPTIPAPTTPAPTEPIGCSHEWQCIHHEEVGHWIAGVICDCGWTAYGNPDTLTGLWNAHSASFPPAESLFEHGGFGCVDDWIVDEPAYDEWVCRHCGEQKP